MGGSQQGERYGYREGGKEGATVAGPFAIGHTSYQSPVNVRHSDVHS